MSTELQESLVLEQRPRLREACIRLSDIASELGPDAKLPTMLELSGRFGMSVKTLNSAVRELERRQILYSINGVGIYVASKKKQRPLTGNLGFLTNNIRHIQNLTYWGLITSGMRREAEQRDRHLLFIDNVERFHQWNKIDGAVFTDMHETSYTLPLLPRPPKGLPSVAMLYPMPGLPSITTDDFRGVYDLTRYLVGLGHKRIAYLAAQGTGIQLLDNRLEGYLAALKDSGIAREDVLIRDLYLKDLHLKGAEFGEIGQRHTERWLSQGWKEAACTAIIAQNDQAAEGIIKALTTAGLRIPADVSVTGFDGIPGSSPYKLTTVEVPLLDIGQEAVRLLCEWVEDPTLRPGDILLPGRLIEGETAAAPLAKSSRKARG